MAVWLVRAGGQGERQEFALDNSVAVIGWDTIPDLSQFKGKDQLEAKYHEIHPEAKINTLRNWVAQLWAFSHRIEKGDLVVLPLKGQNANAIAFGKVMGDYEYRPQNPNGAKHCRPVKWITQDMPRTRFDKDILHSFGAFMTVCQIRRNNAEERIQAILTGKKPPAPSSDGRDEIDDSGITDDTAQENLEENAKTQIMAHIGQKFAGHRLADLVEAVLTAQGYKSTKSEPGPDGGVDIIAGRGAMGFDPPKLCVQVKSSSSPLDIKVLRELKGVMKDFGAEQGLLVAWGGFKRTVVSESRRAFFEIRLWDAGDLVQAIQDHYDHFSEDLKADLPLKRIWTLVQEDE